MDKFKKERSKYCYWNEDTLVLHHYWVCKWQREKHRWVVCCRYNDDVPVGNMSQLIHQAVMSNLRCGLFVLTSIATDEEAELLQKVIVSFSDSDEHDHFHRVNEVEKSLFGWIYSKDILDMGFLFYRRCAVLDYQRLITSGQSHFPMWCALYLKTKNGGKNEKNKHIYFLTKIFFNTLGNGESTRVRDGRSCWSW